MTVNRLLINLLSERLVESARFYTTYFDFKVDFESDWFIHLISEEKGLEIGLINPSSEVVPNALPVTNGGFYLTMVVDDVEVLYPRLLMEEVNVLQAPHETFYGQRRLLIEDLNGMVLDISSPLS